VTSGERAPRWRARLALLALGAAGIGGLALTGGLAPAPPRAEAALATAAVEQKVDGGRYTLAVSTAATAAAIDQFKPSTEGNYLLAVAVNAEVVRAEDSAGLESAVTLPDLAGVMVSYAGEATAQANNVVLVRDGSRVEHLQPGLPERLAYLFEIRAGTPKPTQVTVELKGWVSRFNPINRQDEWVDIRPVARVTVPVRDLTT
jgi:hypothetical protein